MHEIIARSPKKGKAKGAAGMQLITMIKYNLIDLGNATVTADTALTSGGATKKGKAKGAAGMQNNPTIKSNLIASTANATVSSDAALTSGGVTKNAGNATVAASPALTSATGKKGKGAAAANLTAGAGKNATGAAGGKISAGKANSQKAGNAQNGQLADIVKGLTGLDLSSLGLRDLPVLESRKKKNGTATAGAATVSL